MLDFIDVNYMYYYLLKQHLQKSQKKWRRDDSRRVMEVHPVV